MQPRDVKEVSASLMSIDGCPAYVGMQTTSGDRKFLDTAPLNSIEITDTPKICIYLRYVGRNSVGMAFRPHFLYS